MHMLGVGQSDAWVSRRDSGFVRPDRIIAGMHKRRASTAGYEFPGTISQPLIKEEVMVGNAAASNAQRGRSRQVAVAQHSRRGHSVMVQHANNSEDGQDTAALGIQWEGSSTEDRRLRQLTHGNNLWSGRRGASVDGALTRTLGYLLEFDDEGGLQQRPEIASCETFNFGSLSALAAMEPCESDSQHNEDVVRQGSASMQCAEHDDLNMTSDGIGSSIVRGPVHASGPVPEQHRMSLAKRYIMSLRQGYGVDESLDQAHAGCGVDDNLQQTHPDALEQEIMYCAVTGTQSAAGAAMLAAHQRGCALSAMGGIRESGLIDLLRKQPLERMGTGIEDFGFVALGALTQDDEVRLASPSLQPFVL